MKNSPMVCRPGENSEKRFELHKKLYTFFCACQVVPHERSLRRKCRAVFLLTRRAMSSNGQNNHNEKMSARASEVWLSLLEDLKQTPLDIPETWTKETSAIWDSEELALVVTVPDDTSKEWLDRRFFPIASIFFQETNKQKSLILSRVGEGGKDALLVRVQKDAYEQIVNPQKMIPVPFYLFHHWLPVLGASLFWVTIAVRQQSFVNIARKGSVQKLISSRELSYWSPLSFSQIAKLLKKGGFSSWFFKKTKEGYQDVPPEYIVWSQVPVAPHHVDWIEDFVKKFAGEESASSVIESLLDKTGEIRRVKPGDVDLLSSVSKKRITLHDVVSKYFPGEQDEHIYDLVTQLEHQISRPNMFLSIPHYFFEKYRGELNPNEVALIWYLRSLYKEEGNDSIQFDGYSQIGQSVGCSSRTAHRLLSNCIQPEDENVRSSWNQYFQTNLPSKNWLSVHELAEHKKGSANKFSVRVRATEPIHQDDKDAYESLVADLLLIDDDSENDPETDKDTENIPIKEPGQNNTPDGQNTTPEENAPLGEPGRNNTPVSGPSFELRQNNTSPGQNDTPPGQKNTGPSQNSTRTLDKITHLNSSINLSLKSLINESLIPPPPDTNDPNLSTYPTVVGVREINLEKLLGFGSYKHNEKKNLVEVISKNQDIFLAWIIRNHTTAAKFPVRLAVKNIQEGNETEVQYLEIAKLGWGIAAEMVRVSEHVLDLWKMGIFDDIEGREYLAETFRKLSKPAGKAIKNLKETEFILMVENVLLDEEE